MKLPSLSKWQPQTGSPLKRLPEHYMFIKQICAASVFLLVSIWIVAAWIYGSLYQLDDRTKHLKILLVDLDGDVIGLATFIFPQNTSKYNIESAYDYVFRGRYWGALIAMPNATRSFNQAITSGDTTHKPSPALLSIWNEARWALVGESVISPSIQLATTTAQALYNTEYASNLISNNSLTVAQSNVLLQPFELTTRNIYPFSIGIKPFINTVGFVFPTLIQFFFSMALTKISAQAHINARLSPLRNYMIRFFLSRLWSFLIALSSAGWFFAFAESRIGVKPHTYILVASNMWIYTLISFEYHDICAVYIPIQFLPVSVLVWIIANVTTAAFPCVLKPAIYRVEYAVPSVNVFEIFGTILSGGAGNTLGRNLGVLFAWLVVTGLGGWVANASRCHAARERERIEKMLDGV
ncbi:Protein of unknown function (DUF3533) domain containing protein [Hyaloscypha variabilis]